MYESSGIAFPVPVQEDTSRIRTPLDGGNSIYNDDAPGLDKMIDPSSIRRAARKKAAERRAAAAKASTSSPVPEEEDKEAGFGTYLGRKLFGPKIPKISKGAPAAAPHTKPVTGGTQPSASKPSFTPTHGTPQRRVADLESQLAATRGEMQRMQEVSSGNVYQKGHPFQDIQKVHQGRFSRWATGPIGEQVIGLGGFIALPMIADMLGLGLPGQLGAMVAAPMLSGYLTRGFQAGKARALKDYTSGLTAEQSRQKWQAAQAAP
jgi:hypothetical protein